MQEDKNETSLVSLSPSLVNRVKKRKLQKLLFILLSLKSSSARVSLYSHEYDYKDIPFNGHRSFLKIVQLYFYEVEAFLMSDGDGESCNDTCEEMMSALTRHRRVPRRAKRQLLLDLTAAGEYFQKHFDQLLLMRSKDIEMKTAGLDELHNVAPHVYIHPIERQLIDNAIKMPAKDISPMFNVYLNDFHLHPVTRKFCDMFLSAFLLIQLPLRGKVRMFFDPQFRAQALAKFSARCELTDFLRFYGIFSSKFVDLGINCLVKCKLHMEKIRVNRQTRFGFSSDGSLHTGPSVYAGLMGYGDAPSGVLTYRNRKLKQTKKLIFFCHGGAFISTSALTHQAYLSTICEKVQVPIYCPEYTKAQEKPFPYALQDLLDAYLQMFKVSSKGETVLGFIPRKIIIAGDSAGGCMALSLTIALNEIAKVDKSVIMPRALHLMYPVASSYMRITPSRLLANFDSLLNRAFLFAVSFVNSHGASELICQRNFRNEKTFDHLYSHNMSLADKPFYNPCIYRKFFEMKDISLFIQCCEFDPLLDDSIEIARVWRGPVKMQVLQGHSHAYLFFKDKSAFQVYIDTLCETMQSVFNSDEEADKLKSDQK